MLKNTLKNVLGVMSGTSFDGIDVSIVKTDGKILKKTKFNFTNKFSKSSLIYLNKIVQNQKIINDKIFLIKFEKTITNDFIKAIVKGINQFPERVDLIGVHGQTIYHSPKRKKSLQICNGKEIANKTKIKVVNNFRQNDLENNGQGAPLAPIYHKYLLHEKGFNSPTCFINIGGISNLTYIDKNNLIGFDTGPGNVLLNDYVLEHLNLRYDESGKIAKKGVIDRDFCDLILKRIFFKKKFPKSADRNDFHYILSDKKFCNFNVEDSMANLTFITAKSIKMGIDLLPKKPNHIIICGGGKNNKFLVNILNDILKTKIIISDKIGINGDFVESELIAYLAMRCIKKLPITFPSTTGIKKPITGGVIHNFT